MYVSVVEFCLCTHALFLDGDVGEVHKHVVQLVHVGVVLDRAEPGEPRPELSGHFHPKLRMTVRGRRIARRCFLRTETKLILPAFGALTGGLDVDHPEIARACAAPAEALVALADRLACFPVGASRTMARKRA